MSGYIHFTNEEKEQAASVDLEQFLLCRGERLLPSGREKRLEGDHSITIHGSEWYDHAEDRGGHAISFVQKYYDLSYPEAVTLLLGGVQGVPYPKATKQEVREPQPFHLPPASRNMRRTYAYLVNHRKIDRSIVSTFARAKLLYEDEEYHNAVFVGRDQQGVARHAHKRSTNSAGKSFRLTVAGSDFHYSFHHIGHDDSLYVFEAPIDLMSYISMHQENWEAHNYVSCCGTSSTPVLSLLSLHPQIKTVYLCLDNDDAGHKACLRMAAQIAEQFEIASDRLTPLGKDWNDDLVVQVKQQQKEVTIPCQTFG